MNEKAKDFDEYLELIEKAIEVEKESESVFESTEEETDNIKVKRWISSLRFDEIIHIALLESLQSLIERKREIFSEIGGNFSYPNLSREEAESIYKDIQNHLDLEKKQIRRLKDLEDIDLGMVNIGSKIKWMVKEESNHHEELKKFSSWLEDNYDF